MAGDAAQKASLAAGQAQEGELQALQQQVSRLKGNLMPGQNAQQKLRKACNDFEAVFISKLWEQMRATVPKSGMMHSPQEDMYRSMFDRDFAEKMASDGGIGLGDMLYGQLKGKIKNTKTITGQTGLETVAAAKAQADAATTRTTKAKGKAGAIDPTGTAQYERPSGKLDRAILKALHPVSTDASGAANPSGRTFGMEPAGSATITSPRASSLISSASTVSSTAVASGVPTPPASVSGEVMADVDALAQRILEERDHRLRVDGIHPDQLSARRTEAEVEQAAASYRKNSAYGSPSYSSGDSSGDSQGREGASGTGRKLATIG
ncbi:MAG: hypothetical protein AUJ49_01835 [Desulfovibrionaceae bacterium CG1_02_65_16]|nr:MAG: hypothetical protein AUJ49_01835 [Desulfovibrionaceae bacterium CG1_02_65_16]